MRNYSQSGCKLLFYTDFGVRHVILACLIAMGSYAWLITKAGFNKDQLDSRLRSNLPWLIMLAFAIEAVFGIAPAIYADMLPTYTLVKSLMLVVEV